MEVFLISIVIIALVSTVTAKQTIELSTGEDSILGEFVFTQILQEAYERIGITPVKRLFPNTRAISTSNER